MSEPYYLVLDTETGGLDPLKNSLLQFGGIVTDRDFRIVDVLTFRVKSSPLLHEHPKALEINGINIEEHNANPATLGREDAKKRLEEFLAAHTNVGARPLIPCGWNPAFDVGFVKQIFIEWEFFCKYFNYDIASVAQKAKRDGTIPDDLRGLHATARYCGLPVAGGWHDALVDADLTRQLAIHLKA